MNDNEEADESEEEVDGEQEEGGEQADGEKAAKTKTKRKQKDGAEKTKVMKKRKLAPGDEGYDPFDFEDEETSGLFQGFYHYGEILLTTINVKSNANQVNFLV